MSKFAATFIVFSILAVALYIYWKYPRYIIIFYWLILVSGAVIIIIGAIWAQGIPNGLFGGLICATVYFIVGYLRFFWREKFAKSLVEDIEQASSDENDSKNEDD